jgi:ABC-type anion transport system duplicated permease subunit
MLRSIFVTLGSLLLTLLLYVLVPLLLIGIVAALLFGIGSLLTRVFAVTTFEATLVATLVAIPLVWLYYRLLRHADLIPADLATEQDELSEPLASIEPLIIMPRRPSRRSKRGAK